MFNRERKNYFVTAVLIIVFSTFMLITFSSADAERFNIGVNANFAYPQGEFGDNIDRNAYGFSIEALHKNKMLPFRFGIQVGFLQYGHERRTEKFIPNIPEVDVRVDTTNDILAAHMLLRFQKDYEWISPYCEGLFGFNYIFTQSSIKNEQYWNYPILTSTNHEDTALSYGAGAGMLISLYKFQSGSLKGKKVNFPDALEDAELMLDLKARYLMGGEADFLREGSIIRDGDDVSYDVVTSKTDLMMYQVGIVFRF